MWSAHIVKNVFDLLTDTDLNDDGYLIRQAIMMTAGQSQQKIG